MSIYAIGDLHLSLDPRTQKPMDVFGPSWENHAERLRANWEDTVGPEDTVIVCGDISWGLRLEEALTDLRWVAELPGRKVITKGNHDLWWGSLKKLNAIDSRLVFIQNDCWMMRDGTAICGTRGWICPGTEGFDEHDEKIYRRELLRLRMSLDDAVSKGAERMIGVLHYPPSNDKLQISGFMEMLSEYGAEQCVYGHLHGREAFGHGFKGVMNGVNYRLVSLDYVGAVPVKID